MVVCVVLLTTAYVKTLNEQMRHGRSVKIRYETLGIDVMSRREVLRVFKRPAKRNAKPVDCWSIKFLASCKVAMLCLFPKATRLFLDGMSPT
jgi:hypothetical protein